MAGKVQWGPFYKTIDIVVPLSPFSVGCKKTFSGLFINNIREVIFLSVQGTSYIVDLSLFIVQVRCEDVKST